MLSSYSDDSSNNNNRGKPSKSIILGGCMRAWHRESTNQWVYELNGTLGDTNYTFRYSHKFKIVAYIMMKLGRSKDFRSIQPKY